MSAVQMNVRMDSALKASGNAALAELGFTPSQAVRALWEFITLQGTLPPALMHLLRDSQAGSAADDGTRGNISEGAALISSFYTKIGIDEPMYDIIDYDELRELSAAEQLEKWGLS